MGARFDETQSRRGSWREDDVKMIEISQDMDVNAIRQLVDEVAAKKAEYGPIEIGISRSLLFQVRPTCLW